MLQIILEKTEVWDNLLNEFTMLGPFELNLEHSLVSISKWEAKHNKPFLGTDQKTSYEMLDYVKCMTLNKNISDYAYSLISKDDMIKIKNYIDAPMTATKIRNTAKSSNEIVTNEIIYYWMIELGIPVEFEKWHLNRLMTLISVCSIKKTPEKKMSNSEILARNRLLNEQRKAKYNTKG